MRDLLYLLFQFIPCIEYISDRMSVSSLELLDRVDPFLQLIDLFFTHIKGILHILQLFNSVGKIIIAVRDPLLQL